MARQAALLLLTIHGYDIPTHAVNNAFYRQALDLDLRGKREYTEAVLSANGWYRTAGILVVTNLCCAYQMMH